MVTLSSNGDVKHARCSCVAGAGGYCNHTIALLYLIDHTLKIGAETFPEVGACTDNPQQWHKPRTMGIKPEPIMGYKVINPEYRQKPSSGITCSLYEERKPIVQNNNGVQQLKDKLSQQFPNLGFVSICNSNSENVSPTQLHLQVPLGSVLSYQLSPNEGNFEVLTNITNSIKRPIDVGNNFPGLPHNQVLVPTYAGAHTSTARSFLESLVIDDPLVIEQNTRGQCDNPTWFNMRKNRLTSSNFGAVCKRKSNTHDKFIKETLLNPKDISNVPPVKYGLENEMKAAQIYEKNMTSSRNQITLMQCGTIINPRMPWLSTSPDRKVLGNVFGPAIVEIKCPYTLRNLKPKEACKDPNFFCSLVDGKPTLKKDHNYYYQIQGQLGICGLPWCDFVVFFQRGLIIERILFDRAFWSQMASQLTVFYHEHMLPIITASLTHQQFVNYLP